MILSFSTIMIGGVALYAGSSVYQRRTQRKSWLQLLQTGDAPSAEANSGEELEVSEFDEHKGRKWWNFSSVEVGAKDGTASVTFKQQVQGVIELLNQKKNRFFLEEERSQQIKEMSENAGKREISEMEKKINLNFGLSLASLGLATAGTLLYSPLILTAVPLLAYTSIELVQGGVQSLVKGRRVGWAS